MTNNLYIYIEVDTNDGDYAGELTPISEEDIELFKPLVEKIKNFKPYKTSNCMHDHNWPTRDILRKDLGEKHPREIYDISKELEEKFEEYCPYCEFGFHTINRVTLLTKVDDWM